jgi:hypothetical protein
MSFVHAIPLAVVIGLPLIPVALHLFARQRVWTVELPTFRFLLDAYVRQRRRTRFHELLIAALRVLCVLGLVALVARPVADRESTILPGGDGRDVVLLIDCSASMGARADGRSSLERAKATAAARVTPDDRVTLVRVTSRPEVILRDSRATNSELRVHLDQLETAASPANLRAALAAVFSGDRRLSNPIVYFFTDMQAGTFKELDVAGGDRVLPAGTPFVCVDVGTKAPRANVAVIGNPPARHRIVVGLPVSLTARVVNCSPEPVDGTLTLVVNEREVERQAVKLGPNETVARPLSPYVPQAPGPVPAKLAFVTAAGADAFPDDDAYSFVIPVEPKGKVLIVNGGPAADPFEDEILYLRAALQPGRDATAAFDVKEEPEGAWAGLDEPRLKAKLDEYAVVILADAGNLHRITSYAYSALRAFVQDGGGLILFPGDRVEPSNYNLYFFRTPPPIKDHLLAVQLGAPDGDPDRPDTFRRLAKIDFDHPIFRPFQTDGRYFDRVVIKRRWPLTVQPGSPVSVLAEYADRSPAVVEGRYGDGCLVLFTFPANGRWTTLPVNGAEFVPLVLQTVNHVRRRADFEGPGWSTAGERVTVSVVAGRAPVVGTVESPRGTRSDLAFERFGGRVEAAFDATEDRGFYKSSIRSGRDGSQSADLRFAVNVHPDESDSSRSTEDRVRDLFPAAAVTVEDRTAESERAAGPDTDRELWRYVIYALFVVIGFELMLATFGGSATQTPGD